MEPFSRSWVFNQIKLTDGKVLKKERAFPKGDPRDPLTTDELNRKFAILANDVLSKEKQKQVFQMIQDLESVKELHELMHFLAK